MTQPASTRSGLRRWLLRVSLTLGASLLVVVCLEGALRLVAAPVLADSDEGPLVNEFTQTLPGVKSNVRYERNRFGLRALTMDAREKPPRTVRILCLGASTTNQAPQATADTWCGLLERSLQPAMAARGLRIETAGHGRPGHGAADVTRWARTNVPLLQPDLVITLLGINDLAFAAAPKSFGKELERGIGAAERPADAGPDRPSLRERCRQMSQLCQRVAVAAARAQQLWQVATGRALEWHSSQLPALQSRYQDYPAVNEVPREPESASALRRIGGRPVGISPQRRRAGARPRPARAVGSGDDRRRARPVVVSDLHARWPGAAVRSMARGRDAAVQSRAANIRRKRSARPTSTSMAAFPRRSSSSSTIATTPTPEAGGWPRRSCRRLQRC